MGKDAVCHLKDRNVKEEDVGLYEVGWDEVMRNPEDWDEKVYLCRFGGIGFKEWSRTEVVDAAAGLVRLSKKERR